MHVRPVAAAALVVIAAAFASYHALVTKPKPAFDFDARSQSAANGKPATTGSSMQFGGPASGGDSRRDAARTPGSQRLVVYVAGEIARPGLYRLLPGARADDAVRAAGGATAAGDLVAVNLAEPVSDGQEIAIPARGSPEAEAALAAATGDSAGPVHHRVRKQHAKHRKRPRRHRPSVDASADAGGENGSETRATGAASTAGIASTAGDASQVVDVNASSEAELEALPGIGPALAERIVAFRDLNGPFASADELLDVAGMTPGKLDALADLITFH